MIREEAYLVLRVNLRSHFDPQATHQACSTPETVLVPTYLQTIESHPRSAELDTARVGDTGAGFARRRRITLPVFRGDAFRSGGVPSCSGAAADSASAGSRRGEGATPSSAPFIVGARGGDGGDSYFCRTSTAGSKTQSLFQTERRIRDIPTL